MPEESNLLDLLIRDGVARSHAPTLTPLGGGVSSEIYLVDDAGRRFVVKRALRRLKVRDDWFADPRRNLHEQDCIRYIASILPGAVPDLLHASREHCYFAMECLGGDFVNWKQQLLSDEGSGVRISDEAAEAEQTTEPRSDEATHGAIPFVASSLRRFVAPRTPPAAQESAEGPNTRRAAIILATIHHRSRGDTGLAAIFDTTDDFTQLRIDPYLLTTAARHPDLRERFEAEAARLAATREALVHGDFSPKNILLNSRRMVILDCEVAWYGDPAFDIAFLLNHLLLKALFHAGRGRPPAASGQTLADAAWQAYRDALSDHTWAGDIERRTVPLLLMLLLARVDGKSPVEYLDMPRQQLVREFVHRHLPRPPQRVNELSRLWRDALNRFEVT